MIAGPMSSGACLLVILALYVTYIIFLSITEAGFIIAAFPSCQLSLSTFLLFVLYPLFVDSYGKVLERHL